MPAVQAPLTVEERIEKNRLIVRDTIALSTLLAIAIALSFVTYLLFHSFSEHQIVLKQRWKARGERSLADHKPSQAIESLRSALAYDPDDRALQIELATALAQAGRTQEAVVYFDTLREAEPGDGMINLQLARLAVIQGKVQAAVDYYQASVDGTWNGDGVVRRREVRLELARLLIAQHRFDEARNELLIAAGNAADNHPLQLTAAGLLEQAQGEADAYTLYRKAASYRDTRTAGLIGEGRTAAAQSHYLLARNLLQLAASQPDFSHLSDADRAAVHSLLGEAVAILDLYPAQDLPLHVQAVRVMRAVQIVRGQIDACAATGASGAVAPSPAPVSAAPNKPAPEDPHAGQRQAGTQTARIQTPGETPAQTHGALSSALSAVQRAGNTLAHVATGNTPTPPSDLTAQPNDAAQVEELSERWRQLPPDDVLERRMEHDPALLENTLQLVYDIELFETRFAGTIDHGPDGQDHKQIPGCAPPPPDAALLLKIASAPDQIDQL